MTKTSSIIISLICLSLIALLFSFSPIAQNISYHLFADNRYLLFIPNNLNVISNIPFLLVGLYGLWVVLSSKSNQIKRELKPELITFFIGVSLVSVGSGYYHIAPDNQTLIWDRLPMTIAFMALFSVTIGEFISLKYAKPLLIFLLSFGIFSVVYWSVTEAKGVGDLRFYILVQFLPMLLIPVFLLLGENNSRSTSGYWQLIGCYALSKVFEHYDEQTLTLLSEVSGHSLKHIFAAIGIFLYARSYLDKSDIVERVASSE